MRLAIYHFAPWVFALSTGATIGALVAWRQDRRSIVAQVDRGELARLRREFGG